MAVDDARKKIARTINADPEQIIFTSGGSESNTLAIMGVSDYLRSFQKMHIIVSSVEHHSVLSCAEYLEKHGFEVTYLPVEKDGSLRDETLLSAIRDDTGLVSVMAVNNETGNLYQVERIGEICRKKRILFHTDFVQAYGSVMIDVKESNIDFLSVSGHKIHAPKGIGFLYAKNMDILSPVVQGGGQEYGLRGGTENVPYIVGLGRAAEIAYSKIVANQNKYKAYRELMVETIRSFGNGRVHVNGTPFLYSKTVNLRFDGIDGETLLMLLDVKGVAVSAGSACSAHSSVPSHVLKALGLTDKEARSSIRISIPDSLYTEEAGEALCIISEALDELEQLGCGTYE